MRGQSALRKSLFSVVLATMLAQACLPASAGPQKKPDTASSAAAAKMFMRSADYQNTQKWDRAISSWRDFLRKYPGDQLSRQARNYLGVCLLQKKSYAAAATEFEKVVRQNSEDVIAEESLLNLGWCHYSLGFEDAPNEFRKAAHIFTKHVREFPNSQNRDQALYYLAECLALIERPQDAAVVYQELITQYPQSSVRADALFALGAAHQESKDRAAAEATYRMLIKEYPDHRSTVDASLQLADSLVSNDEWEKAASSFQQIATDYPKVADYAFLRRGLCLEKLELWLDAAECYGTLLDQHAESELKDDAALAAGRCFCLAAQPDRARHFLEMVASTEPAREMECAHWQCRAYLLEDQPALAQRVADRVLETIADDVPFRAEVQLDQAEALSLNASMRRQAFGRYLALSRALEDGDLRWRATLGAAQCLVDLNRFADATDVCDWFLERYPDHPLVPDFRVVAIDALYGTNEMERANEALVALIENHPDHRLHTAWQLRLIHGYLQFGDYVAARTTAERCDATGMNRIETSEWLFLKGTISQKLGEEELAIEEFNAAYRNDEDGPWGEKSLLRLADLRLSRGEETSPQETEGILSLIDRPREVARTDDSRTFGHRHSKLLPHALFGQAYTRLYRQQHEQAERLFSQFLNTFPDHAMAPHALYGRSLAFGRLEAYELGLADAQSLLTQYAHSAFHRNARFLSGLYHQKLNQHALAIDDFNKLLTVQDYARRDSVLYRLIISSIELERKEIALDHWSDLRAQHAGSPHLAEAAYVCGEACFRSGNFAEAATLYRTAMQGDIGDSIRAQVLFRLASIDHFAGDHQQAIDGFSMILRDNPSHTQKHPIQFMLAGSLAKAGKHDEAFAICEELRQVSTLSPSDAQRVMELGAECLMQLGQPDRAVEWLGERSSNDNSGNSASQNRTNLILGEAHRDLGQVPEAMARLVLASSSHEQSVAIRAVWHLGQLAMADGQIHNALEHFQTALAADVPADHQELQHLLARIRIEAARCCWRLGGSSANVDNPDSVATRREWRQQAFQHLRDVDRTRFPDLAADVNELLGEFGADETPATPTRTAK